MTTANAEQSSIGTEESQQEAPAPISQENGANVSQQPEVDVQAKIVELEGLIRGNQSKIDKTENAFRQELKSLGVELTPEQQQELRFRELEKAVLGNQSAQVQPSQQAQPAMANEVVDVFNRTGRNPNDPDNIKLASELNHDPIAIALALGNKPASPASPAAVSQGIGQTVTDETKQAQMRAAMREEMLQSRGNPSKIAEIKSRYKQNGLAIDL